MDSLVAQALPKWGLEGAKTRLIAARENRVFRIDHPTGTYALRLHRPDYRTDSQLDAELDWMAHLDRVGLSVPAPLASKAGAYLHHVAGTQVDVLGWLDGQTLDERLPSMATQERAGLFYTLGQRMARLHAASDAWPEGHGCDRPSWDCAGLLGEAPLWDRFWDNPALLAGQKQVLQAFRERAADALRRLVGTLDYGLIHADLVPGNVMVSGTKLHLIDFDDGGFGFRLFELATGLLKHHGSADFEALQAAMINGYRSQRQIDTSQLALFMALRAVTYVGWNITRAHEDQTGARNARFIAKALELVSRYLQS